MPINISRLAQLIHSDSIDNFIYHLHNNISLINNTFQNGDTLLHIASYYGKHEHFDVLINMGALIKDNNKGESLLHYAMAKCYDDYLVTNLVKMGFNPIKKNINGLTPLHLGGSEKIAAYFNNQFKVKKINIESIIDNNGNNITHTSYMQNNIKALKYWIQNVPSIEKTNNENLFWWQCSLEEEIINLDYLNNSSKLNKG